MMNDSQLLRITATPNDVETLQRSNVRLREIVEEQRLLLDAKREEIELYEAMKGGCATRIVDVERERDEARKAAITVYGYLTLRLLDKSLIRNALLKSWPWLEDKA